MTLNGNIIYFDLFCCGCCWLLLLEGTVSYCQHDPKQQSQGKLYGHASLGGTTTGSSDLGARGQAPASQLWIGMVIGAIWIHMGVRTLDQHGNHGMDMEIHPTPSATSIWDVVVSCYLFCL